QKHTTREQCHHLTESGTQDCYIKLKRHFPPHYTITPSYRHYYVKIQDSLSDIYDVNARVPQGSMPIIEDTNIT
ncbi:unnamed protein product, partial [Ceratitis capitata]